MNRAWVFTILLGLSATLVWSLDTFDFQSVAAQTPDDPNAGPIPEGNYTDPNMGPIPEGNSSDTGTIPDNSTDEMGSLPDNNALDIPSDNPLANDTAPDVMTSPQDSVQQHVQSLDTTGAFAKLPPLEQIKSGVSPKDIQCRQGFILIHKVDDGSPACVEPGIAQILAQRGW